MGGEATALVLHNGHWFEDRTVVSTDGSYIGGAGARLEAGRGEGGGEGFTWAVGAGKGGLNGGEATTPALCNGHWVGGRTLVGGGGM